jgi:hypothetical protein
MALKKCKECGESVSTQAVSCPKCGAVLKKKSSCLGVIVAALFCLSVFWFLKIAHFDTTSEQFNTPSDDKSTTATTTNRKNLEVLDYKWTRGDFGLRMITGTVKNNTNKKYNYVQVEINLYDESGTQVDSTLANVNNLEPQSSWRFEAPVINDSAKTAKVKEVRGF